jgi:hypothetical protein
VASSDAWTKARTTEFVREKTVALTNPTLSGQGRALLEAERDGALAWLRYLAATDPKQRFSDIDPDFGS